MAWHGAWDGWIGGWHFFSSRTSKRDRDLHFPVICCAMLFDAPLFRKGMAGWRDMARENMEWKWSKQTRFWLL